MLDIIVLTRCSICGTQRENLVVSQLILLFIIRIYAHQFFRTLHYPFHVEIFLKVCILMLNSCVGRK